MNATASAVESVVASVIASWEHEGVLRQQRSANDQGADTLVACARELRDRVAAATKDDEELTPAEFGALHGKSPSQVRRWCHQDRLEHRRVGRDYRIRRGAAIPAGVESNAE